MLKFDRKVLGNGLTILLHRDESTPLASVNLHYFVGSRDDPPDQTGMAHLFEHLMFSGTRKVPNYDQAVQNAGGENNAFTSSDSTNYHITLPSENIEMAFFLEADRMQGLILTKGMFNREKQVVLEEYKETCLNKPYGDSFHLISGLAYHRHPYRWPTIGLNEKVIGHLKLTVARKFYHTYYQPANAVLSVASNLLPEQLFPLIEKHFGPVKSKGRPVKKYAKEPDQKKSRALTAAKKAPAEAVYLAFHMEARNHPDFYAADLISDILSNGQSARLFKRLVRGKKLVSMIDAYITATQDPGLLMIEAKAIPGQPVKKVLKAIWQELRLLKTLKVPVGELNKMKNTIEASLEFSEINGLNKAITLGYFEMLGDAHRANQEYGLYKKVTPDDILRVARKLFRKSNTNTLFYKKANDGQGYFDEDEEED